MRHIRWFLPAMMAILFWGAPAGAATLELLSDSSLSPGKPVQVVLRLTEGGKPLTLAGLKEVHTKKIHLLVIDATLTDYQHIHPEPGAHPGEYTFTFTPRLAGHYYIWADITPADTGTQEYLRADMGPPIEERPPIDRTVTTSVMLSNCRFILSFDAPPKAGEMVMGHVRVLRRGRPFTYLQPVMGAFAHIAGFPEDGQSVLHAHPLGDEPKSQDARGGPTLNFHMQPPKPGFYKLFVQVKTGGEDVFVPFGVMVK